MYIAYTRLDSRQEAQIWLIRCFALLLCLIWLGRLWMGLGLIQLQNPPFLELRADRVFWLLNSSGILYALLHYAPLSLTIDSLLLLLPLISLRYPLQRAFSWAYLPTVSLYLIAYNASATHHEHTLVGLVAIAFLLCFKDSLRFSLVMAAIRYYACFIMASAALWKMGRGSLWQQGQIESILKLQHSATLTQAADSLWGQWITFLLENPAIANSLWWAAILLELVFLVGFFTRRFDAALFWAFWLFIICDYFVMGLNFWELGILTPLFLRRLTKFLD